jgi:protein-tyrosine phosphatase
MSSEREPSICILFVCLGNICRSPLAEGIFRHLTEESGVEHRYRIDSAGTGGWHAGEPPYPRSVEVARRNGIQLDGSARKVSRDDLEAFDLLIAMDAQNLRDLRELASSSRPPGTSGVEGDGRGSIRLMREFDQEATDDLDVPDPYYGGPDGFDQVFELVERSCRSLLEELETGRP